MLNRITNQLRDTGMDGFVGFLTTFLIDGGAGAEAREFAEGLRVHDPLSLECALRTVPRWVMHDVPSGFEDLPFPVVVVGWDGDPIHPLQTAKDIAAAAGVELIQEDPAAVQTDRTLLGRRLTSALGVG